MNEIVIVSAVRTPIGRLNGSLSSLFAHQLGSAVIKEALLRAHVQPDEVTDVILGQVLTAAAGQNPARQATLAAGLPHQVSAMGINQVCGSGLRAVALGYQSLLAGDATIVIAGGQESMSQSPHAVHMRAGTKMGNAAMIDTMINDGLTDAFHHYHMGQTAENMAERWKVSRTEQDEFAARSQQRAAAAQAAGRFTEEIVPIKIQGRKAETLVEHDEDIRPETTVETLARLRPAFIKENGTVTAGNSSGINDGAAALILMTAEEAAKQNLQPLARIASWATVGVDPAYMGIGPAPATQLTLKKAGWKLQDLDLIEANEAFAAQGCAVGKELGWDIERVNVNGGAIALGHPIGASGARVLVTLLHELRRRDAKRGLATLCIGGSMGIALCVERPETNMEKSLKGKIVLVTGSTSGLGKDIAEALAKAGCDLALNGFGDPAEVESLQKKWRSDYGVRIFYHGANLTVPTEIADLMTQVESHLGSVDILINNAGIQFVAPLQDFPAEKWDAVIALNLSAAFHTTKAVLPGMKTRKWGRIINISSAHGMVASPFKSAYVAAKHGLVGLSKVTALETAREGITCNALCPGFLYTPLVEGQIDSQAKATGISREKIIEDVILAKHATKEFVGADHIAAFVLLLCSEAGASTTGAAIPIDGGWTSS